MSDPLFDDLRQDAAYAFAGRQYEDRKAAWLITGAVCGVVVSLLGNLLAALFSGGAPC
jgi:hypothetical protein